MTKKSSTNFFIKFIAYEKDKYNVGEEASEFGMNSEIKILYFFIEFL